MANQNPVSLRVRISADIDDIKKGLALVQGQLDGVRERAGKSLPAKNGLKEIGDTARNTSRDVAMVMPQITDIITSLQGGMPFTTVLLQQGGQLRDMFGSTSAAAQAVGTAILSMVNPVTVGAAALGALAVAAYQGVEEQTALASAIARTGGVAGETLDDLVRLSEQMETATTTQGKAAETLAAVAASGEIAGQNFRTVAEAAIAMERSTGQSVDKTVEDFAKLAADPVGYIAKLTEQHHFLTESVYSQIKALDEQGNRQAAAQLATETYANTLIKRGGDMEKSLGSLQRAWNGLKAGAASAWDAMLNLGRTESISEQISSKTTTLQALQEQLNNIGVGGATQGRRNQLESRIATIRDEIGKLQDAYVSGVKEASRKADAQLANDAAVAQQQELDQYKTRAEKKADEIKDANAKARAGIEAAERVGNKVLAETIAKDRDQILAAIDKKYAKKGSDGTASATRASMLSDFDNAGDVELARITAQTKVLEAQYKARQISAEQYYSELKTLTENGTTAQVSALSAQIAYLKGQSTAGKDSITVGKQISTLEAKLSQVRDEGAAKLAVLGEQEGALKRQRQEAIETYRAGLAQQEEALQSQMDAMVARVGAGDREYEIQSKLNDIYAKQAEELKKLARSRLLAQGDAGALAVLDQEEADQKASVDRQVEAVRSGYQRMAEAQGSWANGASAAWANYVDEARNVAGQVQNAFSSATTALEDVWVEFAKTGKLSFSDFADSVIADIARIVAKQAAVGLLGSITGGTGTGSLLDLFSSNYMGYDTGGYTGDGGRLEPAGIVHKGEGVLSQYDVAALGGPRAFLSFLGALRSGRGYADGGLAGSSASAIFGGTTHNVIVQVLQGASRDDATAQLGSDGSLNIQVMLKNAVRSMVGSGELDGAFAQRFNLQAAGVRRG